MTSVHTTTDMSVLVVDGQIDTPTGITSRG